MKVITEFKRKPLYGDRIMVSNTESYFNYIGSALYVKILGLFWIRWKTVFIK